MWHKHAYNIIHGPLAERQGEWGKGEGSPALSTRSHGAVQICRLVFCSETICSKQCVQGGEYHSQHEALGMGDKGQFKGYLALGTLEH